VACLKKKWIFVALMKRRCVIIEKEKARLFFKSLAFLMHMVLLLHGKRQVYAWNYQSKENLSIRFFMELG
jgi:hypothetical protein